MDHKADWLTFIGYQKPLEQLAAMHASGRFPQVLMIEGREGIGKRSFARAVAASFFCVSQNGCGRCEGCREVVNGTQLDILWVDEEATTLKLDAAASLQEHIEILPESGSPCRVAVVTNFDRFNEQAMNRLLKTLEEPPTHARIILTTGRRQALLPTILSRAVVWHISPPAVTESLAWLRQQTNLGDGELRLALKLHGLAPGAALRFLQGEGKKDEEACSHLVCDILMSSQPIDALYAAEELTRQWKLSAIELADRTEVILNQYYRARLGWDAAEGLRRKNGELPDISWMAMSRRRDVLRSIRATAGRGRIALNQQLAAEAIAFAHR